MRTPTNTFAAALLIVANSCAAQAQDSLARYRTVIDEVRTECSFIMTRAIAEREMNYVPDPKEANLFPDCVRDGRAKAKAALDDALKPLQKKPKAQEALKTAHVAFLSALDGIAPGQGERKLNYERRQQELRGKVTEALARLEIEM